MQESWDGPDWSLYGHEPAKEHHDRSMYDFIASVEHAPDIIEPDMTKPRRPAKIAPPLGLSKTPTRSAFEALAGGEETSASAPDPTPRREHSAKEIRGESKRRRACQNGYTIPYLERGHIRNICQHGAPQPLSFGGARDVPALLGDLRIPAREPFLHKDPDVEDAESHSRIHANVKPQLYNACDVITGRPSLARGSRPTSSRGTTRSRERPKATTTRSL